MITQRQPQQGVLDIIGLSEGYILGQLGTNQTRNSTLSQNHTLSINAISSQIRRNRQLNVRAVEGLIQYRPGQSCLDGSCYGKCGFKDHNCGAECISNRDAKAMCGIDSADKITLCGLKLSCSYYGWCGTEDVHCKAKTPCQVGFGSCEIKPYPSCSKSSGTTRGRRWSLNDPGTATYNAYSNMVSTQAKRGAFINSLINRYVTSLTIAPDYRYVRSRFPRFKPVEMQDYVDFLGFMRKYKLTVPSCDKMGCRFIGGEAGALGYCTIFPGVLSNREIRRMTKDDGIKPYLNETAMDNAETYAMKEVYANDRCLSIDFDDETGGGISLDNPNMYKSLESATIIPLSHTIVPASQKFTLGSGAATNMPRLLNGGNQNNPSGSVGNPILVPANVPTPMDYPLPVGLVPNQPFKYPNGKAISANQTLPQETVITQGAVFTLLFLIGTGSPLYEGEGDGQNSTSPSLIWLTPDIWKDPNQQVQCFFPRTPVLPPWLSYTTTIDYPRITCTSSVIFSTTTSWPPVTYTTDGVIKTTRPPGTVGPDPMNHPGPPPGPEPTDSSGGGGTPPCLWPLCPGPPPPLRLPSLTISWGPPKPTGTPCAYPALNYLPPGNTQPLGPVVTVVSEPDTTEPTQEGANEEVDEENLTCRILPTEPSEPDPEPQPEPTWKQPGPPKTTTQAPPPPP
ncbi:hypothetical protein BKA66DRAFT_515085 [Pyrenochaeta sp. MPI-SDFR-AT-0127]|nr:hypothetical protein BKA66DRAFT_515085 [Pyrenochaeta sp. MPI-SDFR-AT-0127]